MYELLFQFPGPDRAAIQTFPSSVGELAELGVHRANLVDTFRRILPPGPTGLWPGETLVPYALPFFPRDVSDLADARATAHELGLGAEAYHIDVRRNMQRPDYQRCLLIPAHHDVPADRFEAVCIALRRFV
jgi:hypothetical protein